MRQEIFIVVNRARNSVYQANDGTVEYGTVLGAQKALAGIPEGQREGFKVENLFKYVPTGEKGGGKSDKDINDLVKELRS